MLLFAKTAERYQLLSFFYLVMAEVAKNEKLMNKARALYKNSIKPHDIFAVLKPEILSSFKRNDVPGEMQNEITQMIFRNVVDDCSFRDWD